MIDRVGLASLSPAQRAEVIYSEARSTMTKRLWEAALGGRGSSDGGGDDRPRFGLDARMANAGGLDALFGSLGRDAIAARTDYARPLNPAPAPPDVIVAGPAASGVGAVTPPAIAGLTGLGPNAGYTATLAAAAERVGVPAPALAAIVDAEAGKATDGSWKNYSRNPRSSAAGLGQFLNRTWEGLAETRGTWLHDHAARQGWLGADGQVRADARAALLATRYDPTAAINGIADYARRNLDGLERAGVAMSDDVTATARLAYLGHHLGLGDAVRFLRGHGLSEDRARTLLTAQVGTTGSARRVAATGDATGAHRAWLSTYLDRNIRPTDFQRPLSS